MKKFTIFLLLVILLAVIGVFVYSQTSTTTTGNVAATNNNPAPSTNQYQKVVIGMKNNNYEPNEIRLKVGIPVQISLDSSVVGCYRTFTIRQLGIIKTLRTPQDTIDFTPSQKGTFQFACSMGMGTGAFIVE